MDGEQSWYVVQTQPRKELVAVSGLRNQRFETFFPQFKRQASPRKPSGLSPLFPGYVFVSFDHRLDRWQSINGTFGVKLLLGCESRGLTRVPPGVMTRLFARCPDGVWGVTEPDFRKGEAVSVTGGPFAGLDARFDEFLPQERVRILLNWLTGAVPVSLSRECIGKVA